MHCILTEVTLYHLHDYLTCLSSPLELYFHFFLGCKPHSEVSKVVKQNLLLRDLPKLSPAEQTTSLEAFHKVVCHFAPKLVHYQHAQMEAR